MGDFVTGSTPDLKWSKVPGHMERAHDSKRSVRNRSPVQGNPLLCLGRLRQRGGRRIAGIRPVRFNRSKATQSRAYAATMTAGRCWFEAEVRT